LSINNKNFINFYDVNLKNAKKISIHGNCYGIGCKECPLNISLDHNFVTCATAASVKLMIPLAKKYINDVETQEYLEQEFMGKET
jgi:hypothetical protein